MFRSFCANLVASKFQMNECLMPESIENISKAFIQTFLRDYFPVHQLEHICPYDWFCCSQDTGELFSEIKTHWTTIQHVQQ